MKTRSHIVTAIVLAMVMAGLLLFSYGMGSEPAMAAQLKFWKKWPQIPAVKEKRFIEVDPDIINRAGPRIIQGLATLAIKLYPEKESAIAQIMEDVKP